MNAAAYIRVSSRAQGFPTQRAAIERAAAARGDQVIVWYAEKRSGKSADRPELKRVRADARAGLIRKLYVFKYDRLTRSGIRDTFELIEELRCHGCDIVAVADSFDLDGPAGEVVLAVMAWAAKMERLTINERISAARERLEAEGRPWGRPPRLSQRDIERAIAMREDGRTWRSIAMALRCPKSTVQRAVTASQKAAQPEGSGGTTDSADKARPHDAEVGDAR
jgi:DNA invertase Pin-like site-specific DNA recombinase